MKILRRSTMQQRSWLMKTLWKDLPPDLVERILSFLPVPSLCRFRAVCKKWNALIVSPEFGELCAKAPRQRSYVLVTANTCMDTDAAGWRILDVTDEKFYTLDNNYLIEYAEKSKDFDGSSSDDELSDILGSNFEGFILDTLAAAGGLFLVLCTTITYSKRFLYVCHPVTKTFKQLPPVDIGCSDWSVPVVVMVTDDSAKSFKIFSIAEFLASRPSKNRMHMYDSQVGKWIKLANPPDNLQPSSCVVNNDSVFTVFTKRLSHTLLTYSVNGDAWSDAGVKLPKGLLIPQLVMSSGQLYMVALRQMICLQDYEFRVTIWKILPSRKIPVRIARMPETWHRLLYPKDPCTWSHYDNGIGRNSDLLAVGSEESILFTSWSGCSVVYDLTNNSWRSVHKHHLLQLPTYDADPIVGLYGNFTTLSLSFPL